MAAIHPERMIARCYHGAVDFLRHYVGGLYHRFDEHHIFLFSSGLSFSIIVCIIPLLLVIFSVLGGLLERPSVAKEIEAFIDRTVPYETYAAKVKEIAFARVEEFKMHRTLAGWLGAIGLLFAASGLFSSMRTVLDTVFRKERKSSVLVGKLHDLGLVLLVLVFFILWTAILPALGIIERAATHVESLKRFDLGGLAKFAFFGASFVVLWIGFYLVYLAVPHRRPPQRVLLLSAFTAAVLWNLAERLFGYYITHIVSFSRVYGTYSFLLVVAFWLYYSSMVFIVGAEVGQLYRERRGGAETR